MFEPPEGYWLAFSGGKDSVVAYDLAVKSGVKFEAHYNVTTVDPPELVKFIKKNYDGRVKFDYPGKPLLKRMLERGQGFPPLRNMRWCCEEYKEKGGEGRTVLTGIRDQESSRRKLRGKVEACLKGAGKKFVHPIKDWNTTDVWDYIRQNRLLYCALYDEGFERLGCVICPFEQNIGRSMARWPRMWETTRRHFRLLYDQRVAGDKPFKNWKNGDEMFEWWIRRK